MACRTVAFQESSQGQKHGPYETKVTFTLDSETVGYLGRTAERLGMPKSQVVREAIRTYGEQMGRLSNEERERLLKTFDEVTASIPDRSRASVDAELSQIRRARERGGRRAAGPPKP